MGFTFLAPLFLAGLAALAIPILIHLTHRERRDAIQFPSLMFLRRVPYRTVRRQRIRHWLLFLLRVAAILLVAAAFARPLLERASLGPAVLGTAREVVILLDRSYSMGYGDRWSRAVAAARRAIDGLEHDDRATIVLFSDGAEAANHRSGDGTTLHRVLDRAKLGSGSTQYGPAFQLARDLLEASDLPQREVVLITDFQRVGWEGQQDLRLPEGTVIRPIDLSDPEPANLAVTGVLLDRSPQSGSNRVAVSARVANAATVPVSDLPVVLEIDGQELQRRSVDLSSDGSATVRFGALAVPDRVTPGRVWVEGDRLSQDDAFHFVVAPVRAVPILVLQHPSARSSETLYLRRALSIGYDPPFDIEVKRVTQFVPSDLDERALVILSDAPFPRGAAGQRLRQFVAGGGGLLVVLGRRSGQGAWTADVAGLLGPGPGTVVDRLGGRGGTLSILEYSHPVFAPFSAPRSGDFSATRFFRYRRYEGPPAAAVLARFDDGAIALTEVAAGAGRVMVWTAGLANLWNDLPVQPVFLPFVHEVARHLSGYRQAPPWYTAGQVVDLALDPTAQPWGAPPALEADEEQQELVIETPSGERFMASAGGDRRHLELRGHGFYVIRPMEGTAFERRVVAVNLDYVESDLTPLDPEELVGAVTPRGDGDDRAATLAAALTPAQRERRQGLWWYLLVAVLLLLLAETALATRLSRAAR